MSAGPYRGPGRSPAAPSIAIDLDSAVPLYRQIADGVRALIARGALADGDALPSVRKLGGMLGVNLNTVAKAYRVLADERVVELKQGAPARVTAPPEQEDPDPTLERRLHDLVGRLRLGGVAPDDARRMFERALARFYGEEEGGES